MYTCRECRDLLWDFVYELLEATETGYVREHLVGCTACQAELDGARAGRQQIRELSILPLAVPEFIPPEDEPATLPLTPSFRSAARRIYPGAWLRRVAVAAGLLLALGVPYGLHHNGLAPP